MDDKCPDCGEPAHQYWWDCEQWIRDEQEKCVFFRTGKRPVHGGFILKGNGWPGKKDKDA